MIFRFLYSAVIFIFFFQFGLCADPRLEDKIIFNEIDIDYEYNPYRSVGDWEGKYKRFYALIHETMYENDNTTNSLDPNFITNSEKIVWRPGAAINQKGIQSKVIISMPGETEMSWKFSNGEKITAEDIELSIKYAICTNLISEDFIPFENVYTLDYKDDKTGLVGKAVHIDSPIPLSKDIYKSYFKNLYVLPSSCFGDYISQGCSYIADIDDESYWDNDCIVDWNDESFVGSGPFYISENIEEKEVVLDPNKKYAKNIDYNGFVVKINSLKAMHARDLKTDVNLLIDIPLSSVANRKESDISMYKQETYDANLLWINYTNRHLVKSNFRKAIYYCIDKSSITKETFSYDAKSLTGPFSNIANFYNPTLEDHTLGNHLDDIEYAKELLKEAGYTFKDADRSQSIDYILLDSNNQPVELTLMHNNDISEYEKSAIKAMKEYLGQIGISIVIRSVNGNMRFASMRNLSLDKWDLCYDKVLIRNPRKTRDFYHSKGKQNYGKYENPDIERLLSNLDSASNQKDKNSIANSIHATLLDDVASIFLWRQYTHYVFYNRQIDPINKNYVDSEHFFVTPHKWKMVK